LTDCIFCKIVAGEIPARRVAETSTLMAFEDVNPQAPVHVLIVPRQHIATLNDLTPDHASLVGEMILLAASVARETGVNETGYRLVMNCLEEAGQTVFHIHMHILGGRRMTWPPG